jgi:hypothetical protein
MGFAAWTKCDTSAISEGQPVCGRCDTTWSNARLTDTGLNVAIWQFPGMEGIIDILTT